MNPEPLLIGCLLQLPHTYHAVVECGVTDESFSQPETLVLWQVASKIIKQTNSLDRYSMLTELRRMKHQAGQELVDTIPHDVNPDTALIHATAVREAEKQRKLTRLISQYSRTTGDIDAHITSLASEAMGILHGSQAHKVHHVSEIAPQVQADLEAIAAGQGENLIGYDSWVSTVNKWGVPYPKGKVTVVAAYRNAGKSTLLKQEAVFHARERGLKVGIISMEDTNRDVLTNTVTCDGAGFMWRYQRGIGDMKAFNRHLAGIKDLPIYIVDQPQTISELEATMTLMVAKYGVQVLFLDHLHEITNDKNHRTSSIDEKYTEYMSHICATIKRLDVGCCLYAQFSRDCEKEGRKPMMADLKGSSAIEQKARRIYILYRDPESATPRFYLEGSKISNSGWGTKEDRQVVLEYAKDHDGFVELT